VTFGVTLSRCVCVRRINLDGDGNARYLVVAIIIIIRNSVLHSMSISRLKMHTVFIYSALHIVGIPMRI